MFNHLTDIEPICCKCKNSGMNAHFICYPCEHQYEKLLKFVQRIANTHEFSVSNHWSLHFQAKEFLKDLGELNEI